MTSRRRVARARSQWRVSFLNLPVPVAVVVGAGGDVGAGGTVVGAGGVVVDIGMARGFRALVPCDVTTVTSHCDVTPSRRTRAFSMARRPVQ